MILLEAIAFSLHGKLYGVIIQNFRSGTSQHIPAHSCWFVQDFDFISYYKILFIYKCYTTLCFNNLIYINWSHVDDGIHEICFITIFRDKRMTFYVLVLIIEGKSVCAWLLYLKTSQRCDS